MGDAGLNVRLLSAGPFVTMVDRFAVAPVLIPIALEFRAPLGAVAIAATAYYFAYGLAQPFWGFASDRLGRVRIIRISLGATAVKIAHHLTLDGGDTLGTLQAVLDTNLWLASHVTTITLGYAATFVAGVPAFSARSEAASVYPGVQNLLLAARALGLAATLTTWHLALEPEFKAVLGIPRSVKTFAIVPVGWPRGNFGPVARRSAAEVIHRDRW